MRCMGCKAVRGAGVGGPEIVRFVVVVGRAAKLPARSSIHEVREQMLISAPSNSSGYWFTLISFLLG